MLDIFLSTSTRCIFISFSFSFRYRLWLWRHHSSVCNRLDLRYSSMLVLSSGGRLRRSFLHLKETRSTSAPPATRPRVPEQFFVLAPSRPSAPPLNPTSSSSALWTPSARRAPWSRPFSSPPTLQHARSSPCRNITTLAMSPAVPRTLYRLLGRTRRIPRGG